MNIVHLRLDKATKADVYASIGTTPTAVAQFARAAFEGGRFVTFEESAGLVAELFPGSRVTIGVRE